MRKECVCEILTKDFEVSHFFNLHGFLIHSVKLKTTEKR